MTDLNTRRTIFIYEAARLAAIAAEAPIVPEEWWNRDDKFKSQMLDIVEQLCHPDSNLDPRTLHDGGVKAYAEMGWVYGAELDTVAKTHPDMVSYDELSKLERDKDEIFVTLCVIARNWIQ